METTKKSVNGEKICKEITTCKVKGCFAKIIIFALSAISFILLAFFCVLLFCKNTETSNYSVKIICCTVLAGLAMILSAIIVCFVIHSKKDKACKIDGNDVLLQAYYAIFGKGDKSDPPDGDNEDPQK